MLADPLVIKAPDLTAATAFTLANTNNFAMIDAGAGRSTRVMSNPQLGGESMSRPATLTISHTVSNENNPVKTDRTLMRVDFLLEDSAGKELKAYAYAVVGVPRGTLYKAAGSDQSIDFSMGLAMLGVLVGVIASAEGANNFDETKVLRILNGES